MDPLQTSMTALAAGDRSAFDAVFRGLWPRCRAFAKKMIDDDALADDAAQAALLQLFHEAPRFDPSRSAVSWALTLTSWQVRTLKRRAQRRREDPVDAGVPPKAPCASPEDQTVNARLVAQALDVVDALSAADREAVMRALDDEASGDPSARKRRQRAFDRLRSFWRARYG